MDEQVSKERHLVHMLNLEAESNRMQKLIKIYKEAQKLIINFTRK